MARHGRGRRSVTGRGNGPPAHAPGDPASADGSSIPIESGLARLEREVDGGVTLFVNGVPSSHHYPEPDRLMFEYLRWALLVIEHAVVPHERVRIAHLGAAGCSLARAVAAVRPQAHQVAVEIDPVLASAVREWFDLPPSPQLRIRVGDALAELERFPAGRFDIVVRDAFAGDRTPRQLTTAHTAARVAEVVGSAGLYLANCADGPPLRDLADEITTLRSVFPHVAAIAEPAVTKGRRYGNVLLVAGFRELPEGLERGVRSDAAAPRLLTGAGLDALAAPGVVR